MAINVRDFINAVELKNGFPLDQNQKDAIIHGDGPLWLIAGPGTGKTEVLVLRCLKLICCDNILPGSILVTTFTEKAARNLEDRLNDVLTYLISYFPGALDVDLSQLRIGTLHSLCNDILQEYRYLPYQNLRLLDSVESQMLIRQNIAKRIQSTQANILNTFDYLFNGRTNPNLWDWTKSLQKIFDRISDYRINISALSTASGAYKEIADANILYEQTLNAKYSCDFGHLLKHFLDFLNSTQSSTFLNGDNTRPPLLHILVDEYQDTNPIQEEIYFTLASRGQHNLTVVGDDDQALYRFRGGTIECMVGFSDKCMSAWGIRPTQIALINNHRSDNGIVNWCNSYITSFPLMAQQNVRVQGKPLIAPSSGRSGGYPSVGLLRESNVAGLADNFADTIKGLLDNGIISDYNQCALLLRSTKESPKYAKPYIEALRRRNIPIYNPRSKSFLEQNEVKEILGALVSVLDPHLQCANTILQPGIRTMITEWISAFNTIATTNIDLNNYILQSNNRILGLPLGERITPAMPTILYRIMSFNPFANYQQNPEQDLRLSKLSRLFEAFCSQNGRALFMDDIISGVVSQRWLNSFYYIFCGYLDSWGMDDDEDEEVVCPSGMLPIMTIHQSKGLEFDFVFVGNLGHNVSVGDSYKLESDLRHFRVNAPNIVHSEIDSAWHDEIRLHYVAFSRAKYALVLMATNTQLRKNGFETASFGFNGGVGLRRVVPRL